MSPDRKDHRNENRNMHVKMLIDDKMAIHTIFDPIWIKENTNVESTVTFAFKKHNIAYVDEVEWQTIYYEASKDKYSLTDDWGGEVFLTWDEFLDMLKERNVERLMEMSINSEDGGMVDKRIPSRYNDRDRVEVSTEQAKYMYM